MWTYLSTTQTPQVHSLVTSVVLFTEFRGRNIFLREDCTDPDPLLGRE